jgi:hypothetical protein
MPQKEGPPQGHEREKSPKTKEMPLAQARDYAEWVKEQKPPTLEDRGALPPDPPEELKEPREHGSKEPTEGGKPS